MSTINVRSHRTAALLAIAAVMALGLAACSDDDSSSTTTTTAAAASDDSTTTTSTTLPGNEPTVSEVYAPQVAESGSGSTAKVFLSITGGAADDSLVGVSVSSDVAASAKLTPESEVALPATETVDLDEDTTYIELTDLAEPLELNRGFKVTLDFATAPDQTVDGTVRDGMTAN